MKHDVSWKPQRSLAALLGSFAGLCVVVLRVGADHSLLETLAQIGVASGAAALLGYLAGCLLKGLIRLAPLAACPEHEVLAGRPVFEGGDFPFDRDSEPGPRAFRRGPVGDLANKGKEAMSMGSSPDG